MNQRRRLGAFKKQILKMRNNRITVIGQRTQRGGGTTTQVDGETGAIRPAASKQSYRSSRNVKRSTTGGVNVIVNK